MNILAIIPARSGSKSIPDKNIRPIMGKPLIAWSIEHALGSCWIDRVIVSTDSLQYAEIAVRCGAETPFLRPSELSDDKSKDIEFFTHALDWLENNEGYIPDICVQLRPTHPVRKIEDIDRMIELLINDSAADSIRSVIRNYTITPFKMWKMNDNNILNPLIEVPGVNEPFNMPRQLLPVTFFQNASVDVIRTTCIREKNSLSGNRILGYVMEEQYDIDIEEDFARVEKYLLKTTILSGEIKNKKICFDIDGVIATLSEENDYSKATPHIKTVNLIRKLFENNKIVLFTARGSETGVDWKKVTENQMKEWGVPFHELRFGKPAADYFIDDRAINIHDLIDIH